MKPKLSRFAIPYVVWMALFVVAPIVLVVVYAFSTDAGGFTPMTLTNTATSAVPHATSSPASTATLPAGLPPKALCC